MPHTRPSNQINFNKLVKAQMSYNLDMMKYELENKGYSANNTKFIYLMVKKQKINERVSLPKKTKLRILNLVLLE